MNVCSFQSLKNNKEPERKGVRSESKRDNLNNRKEGVNWKLKNQKKRESLKNRKEKEIERKEQAYLPSI